MSSAKPMEHSLDLQDDKIPDPKHQERVPAIVTIENFRVLGLDPEDEDFYLNYPPERRKMTRRKVCILSTWYHKPCDANSTDQVDIRLVPMLAVLYLISHLDRANIGNAKIEGMMEDLNLDGIQWNIILSIFFVPYVLLGRFL